MDDADGGAPNPGAGHGTGAPPGRREWVFERFEGGAWALLTILWVIVVAWVFRLGDSFAPLWVLDSGLHLLLLAAWPILLLGLVRRRRALAAAAAVTVVVQLVVAWPMLPRGGPEDRPGRPVTVAALNLFVANPELDRAARQIAADLPDVLVVEELTPAGVTAFARTGLRARFPYRVERPDPDVVGEAVYSRFPLRVDPVAHPGSDMPVTVATLPGGTELRILAVHSLAPGADDWEHTLHAMDRSLATLPEPWIAIGDYNATFSHRVFRDLLHGGRHDAHLITGRGYARSWPASLPLPPLVLIDHALLAPGLHAVSTRERTIAGSDHRMIVVRLRV